MATLYTTPAGTTRQPFAPLNGARLSNLTSLKNRQNAIHPTAAKRKAPAYDSDPDTENTAPEQFTKRSKSSVTSSFAVKPSFTLIPSTRPLSDVSTSCVQSNTTRQILTPRSPAAKINTKVTSSLTAPAGRSPTKKRIGILNRRRTFAPVNPPSFNLSSTSSALPFSLDSALSCTAPTTSATSIATSLSSSLSAGLASKELSGYKPSWDFAIHEDTAEDLLTNLMEHGTCVLDISSDEESSTRREKEGRGKENVPPEVSDEAMQTSYVRAAGSVAATRARRGKREWQMDGDAMGVDRKVLGEVAVDELYEEAQKGMILIADDEADTSAHNQAHPLSVVEPLPHAEFDFSIPDLAHAGLEPQIGGFDEGEGKHVDVVEEQCNGNANVEIDIDTLMQQSLQPESGKAALLEPLEKADEGWTVWESGSAKGDE